MSRQVYKEGTLLKRGKMNRQYKERHFVIDCKWAHYFQGGKGAPQGSIGVETIASVGQIGVVEPGAFSVDIPGRQFVFKGTTDDETKAWRAAFITACNENQKDFA